MSTCKTCAHWSPVTMSGDHRANDICNPLDPDTYKPAVFTFEVRVCRMPTQGRFERPIEPNGFALTDASQYYAALCTAEDFGCVRHQAIA